MSILTGSFQKALLPGVRTWFGMHKDYPAEHARIFEILKSDRNYEEDVGMGGMGLAPIKSEGSAVSYFDMEQTFIKRYIHTVYSLGFIISQEAIEDNLYAEVARARSQMLGKSMRETIEVVCASVLNNAFSGSFLGADGKALCATDHPRFRDGGTYANKPTTDLDLSELALEQAVIDIAKLRNDAGLLISAMPEMLIVPPDLQFEAKRILGSELQSGSANNDLNAIRSMNVIPGGMMVYHYLTDADAWFIKTNTMNGLKKYERRALSINDDTDFDTSNVKFKADVRFSTGWTDARGIYGSSGA